MYRVSKEFGSTQNANSDRKTNVVGYRAESIARTSHMIIIDSKDPVAH